MADDSDVEILQEQDELIEISSEEDEDITPDGTSSVPDTEKEESPDPPTTPKPNYLLSPGMSLKKGRKSSRKRKVKRISCLVCNGRFVSQISLDIHMRVHWNVFNKMEELLYHMKNKIKEKHVIIGGCKCSRCIYESKDNEEPYELIKNFSCFVCHASFYTANKLSKHMDKHREIYYKMKKLEEENMLLYERPIIRPGSH